MPPWSPGRPEYSTEIPSWIQYILEFVLDLSQLKWFNYWWWYPNIHGRVNHVKSNIYTPKPKYEKPDKSIFNFRWCAKNKHRICWSPYLILHGRPSSIFEYTWFLYHIQSNIIWYENHVYSRIFGNSAYSILHDFGAMQIRISPCKFEYQNIRNNMGS